MFVVNKRMGAGALTAEGPRLSNMPYNDAVALLSKHGVDAKEAEIVMHRLRELGDCIIDGVVIATLVENLSPESQDALAKFSENHRLPREEEVPEVDEPLRRKKSDSLRVCAPEDTANDVTLFMETPRTAFSPHGDDAEDCWRPPEPRDDEEDDPEDVSEEESVLRQMHRQRRRHHRNKVLPGRWKMGRLIGAGSFGQVYQGLNLETGGLIAIKQLFLPSAAHSDAAFSELKQIRQEIELMSTLSHPNVTSYYGAEVDLESARLHVFMEWIPGGSLASILKTFGNGGSFDIVVTKRYLLDVLRGLVYLHDHRIVHRDIKGENVLIDSDGTAKLADFGASKAVSVDGTMNESTQVRGTPYYLAPEQLQQKRVGRKADVWALGGLVHLMATGDPPWKILDISSPYALMLRVIESKEGPPLDAYADLASDIRAFLDACFVYNSEDRPSARDLIKHPFLNPTAVPTIPTTTRHASLQDRPKVDRTPQGRRRWLSVDEAPPISPRYSPLLGPPRARISTPSAYNNINVAPRRISPTASTSTTSESSTSSHRPKTTNSYTHFRRNSGRAASAPRSRIQVPPSSIIAPRVSPCN